MFTKANDWLKLIKSKSDRIREHTQKQERKSREREVYMKKKRVKRARKQYESVSPILPPRGRECIIVSSRGLV